MITYPPPPTALPKRTLCSWRGTQVMFLLLFPSLISVAFSPALRKGEMTHFIGDLKKQVRPVVFLFLLFKLWQWICSKTHWNNLHQKKKIYIHYWLQNTVREYVKENGLSHSQARKFNSAKNYLKLIYRPLIYPTKTKVALFSIDRKAQTKLHTDTQGKIPDG